MRLLPVLFVGGFTGVAFVVGAWLHRRQRARLPSVDLNDYLLHRPVDISSDQWVSARSNVANILGVEPAQIDPTMTIDALTRHFTFLGVPGVDVGHVIEEFEHSLSRSELQDLKTVGDLLALYARKTAAAGQP